MVSKKNGFKRNGIQTKAVQTIPVIYPEKILIRSKTTLIKRENIIAIAKVVLIVIQICSISFA